MNGWTRIGIVASVLWMIGAYFVAFDRRESADMELSADIYAPCFESAQREDDHAKWDRCKTEQVTQVIKNLRSERHEAIGTALLPIPLAWGLVYFAIFLVRWVKRGFAKRTEL